MFNRLLHIAFCLALATSASAQYLQGKLQGGSGVPGTTNRSPLNSLERAANNLDGVTIVTDTFGNQRLAYYVRVLDSCVNYDPLTYVGAMPPSCFVYQCGSQDSLFYIDWKGDAVFVGAGGACDEDWLEISDNTCPDAITDSIYHYNYAAIGARLVWPSAELLVNDSAAAVVQILAGDRNARLGFYDNQNQVYSTIDQSGTSTLWYFNPTGEMRWLTSGSGTPQSPGAPFVNQFAIDPNDTPLPTVQAHLYPNTRIDTNTVENFIYTDPAGKFRSRPIDSLIQIVVDSIGGDSTLQSNWYTTNGVTTDGLRVATAKTSAWWRSLDSVGFLRLTVGTATLLDKGQITVFQDSVNIQKDGSDALNYITVKRDKIRLVTTSGDNPFAIDFQTDTINWSSSFDQALQIHNLLPDGTYFFADSTKTVAIGQFADFPNINYDKTERGLYYAPSGDGVVLINGDFLAGEIAYLTVLQNALNVDASTSIGDGTLDVSSSQTVLGASLTTGNYHQVNGLSDTDAARWRVRVNDFVDFSDTTSFLDVYQSGEATRNLRYVAIGERKQTGGSAVGSVAYVGKNTTGSPTEANIVSPTLAFGVQHVVPGSGVKFDYIRVDLAVFDTTADRVSFYNNSYYWQNADPSPTVGDTSFHFWAGTGSATNPGFITLDQIQAGVPNIYNSNGVTTDNTRIATVTETITWLSEDITADGVYPFRFEVNGSPENEPEALTIVFDNTEKDSVSWSKSDQEIFQTSNTSFVLLSQEQLTFQADSVVIENNSMAEKTKVRYLIGGTPNNTTLQKIDGNDAGAGEIMMSNGTDWVETNPQATLRPAQLTATTNNWSPAGWSTYSNQTVVFSGDGNFQTVTGLTAATRDGVTKTFTNDGANCVVFAKQHTSSSAGNRFDITRDLVFLPKMEGTFRYDSVGADWELVSATRNDVTFGNVLETNLRGNSGFFDDEFWDFAAFGGTNNKSSGASSTLPVRYLQLSTSTAATAYPTITTYTGQVYQRASGSYFRQYAKVRFDELSTSAEDFDFRFGWTNGVVDTNIVEGAWISYMRDENSGGFTLKTNNGATTTTTNCGSALAADTWYDIEIIYYPYGEVTVFIDDVRYTTTSTLPEAITTTPILQIDKDNGTTARTVFYSAIELNYVNVTD